MRHLVLLEDGSSRQDFHSAPTTLFVVFLKHIILNYLVLY